MNTSYEHRMSKSRDHVLHEGRVLGALSQNHMRSYVFPLYTPAGVNLLQECPPDHMHHQGIMVGQDLVNGHNFWAMLHRGQPQNVQALTGGGADDVAVDGQGVTFERSLCWRTAGNQSVMHEMRRVRFEAWDGFNFVDVTSTWSAPYGDVHLGQTKEGGLGMRVAPPLETQWGGEVRASTGKLGAERIHESDADWIEVFGKVGPNPVGVVMMPHPDQERVPWFTRDYGLHLFGPMRHQARQLKVGGTLTWRVGFATYDGEADGTQAAKAWALYRQRHG